MLLLYTVSVYVRPLSAVFSLNRVYARSGATTQRNAATYVRRCRKCSPAPVKTTHVRVRQQSVAPQYLSELCVPVADVAGRRQLRSASRGLLYFPRYNMSNYARRAFSCAGPHAWDLLAENVLKSTSIAIFKRSLKTFLFEQITHSVH